MPNIPVITTYPTVQGIIYRFLVNLSGKSGSLSSSKSTIYLNINKFKIPMISAGTALAAVRYILTFYNSGNNTGWVVKYDAVADYHS